MKNEPHAPRAARAQGIECSTLSAAHLLNFTRPVRARMSLEERFSSFRLLNLTRITGVRGVADQRCSAPQFLNLTRPVRARTSLGERSAGLRPLNLTRRVHLRHARIGLRVQVPLLLWWVCVPA